VQHSLLVGIVDSKADGVKKMHNVGTGEKLALMRWAVKIVRQCRSLNIFEDNVGYWAVRLRISGNLEAMYLHDVGMLEASNHAPFLLETCQELRILLQVGIKYLDGNKAHQYRVKRFPDLRHATFAEACKQLIFSEILLRTHT
jgi:hypothetical protein